MIFENKLETIENKWISHVLNFNPISLLLLRLRWKVCIWKQEICNGRWSTLRTELIETKVPFARMKGESTVRTFWFVQFFGTWTQKGVWCIEFPLLWKKKNNLKRWNNNVQPINWYSPILQTSTHYSPPLLLFPKLKNVLFAFGKTRTRLFFQKMTSFVSNRDFNIG